jgi:multiple sugar transport system substrate-binding protein
MGHLQGDMMGGCSRRALVGRFVRPTAAPAAVAGVVLAACASSREAGEGGPVQVTEQVKLTAVLRPTPLEVDLQRQAFAAFEARYPNLKVDALVTDPGEYDTKTDLLLASGTPPALWWPAAGKGYRFYAARGQFEELDAFVARDRLDLSDFYPALLAFCKWKGKLTCLPITVWPHVLLYNKTLLEKERLAPPPADWKDKAWTWARYLDTAQKATKREGGQGLQFGASNAWGSDRFYAQAYGGDWFEPEAYDSGYPKKFAPQKEAVIDGVQFLADLRFRYKVWPTPDEITELRAGNAIPTLFQTSKVAMEFNTPGVFSRYADIKDFAWGVGVVPAPPTLPRNNWFYADQWATFKGQTSRDAAWLLIKHMVSPAALRIWPLQQGAIPARRSLAPEWVSFYRDKAGLPEAELRTPIDAVDAAKITPSHAVVEFAEIYTNAIKPEQDKVFTNEQPMKVAFEKMAPLAVEIMQRTAPR